MAYRQHLGNKNRIYDILARLIERLIGLFLRGKPVNKGIERGDTTCKPLFGENGARVKNRVKNRVKKGKYYLLFKIKKIS